MNRRWSAAALSLTAAAVLATSTARPASADAPPATEPSTAPAAAALEPIQFITDTLPNGLRVIYAPLRQAPVVQVRVLYHVGSRDERPDRQGFAHMFEHMMFRGSRHVPPEEHMRLIDTVGGICNAFTSFDETVYHDTVPAEDLGLALYLEADRMASFKVTDSIYQVERKVVAQEWMLQQNRPYGNLATQLFKTVFSKSSYAWTPIGNMQQLLAAPAAELQRFFNTYYVPNNAVLVIAGDVDVPAARKLVNDYFAWIPAGAPVEHPHTDEPPQTAARSAVLPDRLAQLVNVVDAYHIPPYRSDDQYPLSVLAAILGEGASSRLERALVNNDHPLCASAEAGTDTLEYAGIFEVSGEVLPGKDPERVKRVMAEQVADVVAHGVTDAELARAKTARRVETIDGRATCAQIAGDVGDAALWAGDPDRVNTDLAKLDAVTAADVQAVAAKYLRPELVTTVTVEPDPLGIHTRRATTAAAALYKGAAVAPSTQPVLPRDITFPAGYPQRPPLPPASSSAHFDKGREATVNGVHVIVLSDHRLPLVNWTLCMRRGTDSDPAAKAGLADLTAEMVSHGAGSLTYQQLSDELSAHGITLGVSAAGDNTRLAGSCTTDELDRGFARSRDLLLSPTFPADEFEKVKAQAIAGVTQALASPATAGSREMDRILYGDSPLGRSSTPATVSAVTLDDVKQCYVDLYRPDDAILVVSGDVSFDRGVELATRLTDGWQPRALPPVSYDLPPAGSQSRQIILIDNPDPTAGAGAIVRTGVRAYDIHDADDKFAGSLANTLLSGGIESRLMEYVRAQKGYVYGIAGTFAPGRHGGAFEVNAPTRPPVAGDCVTAIYKVLDDLKSPAGENPLTDAELADAKRRVSGSLVMSMQTVTAQAGMRLDGLLNGYPADYYDVYPQHVNAVTVDQVRGVMDKFVKGDAMAVVVVAPAAIVKQQLEKLGPVTVVPMPLARSAGATTNEMVKPVN
jgi:zinc protease